MTVTPSLQFSLVACKAHVSSLALPLPLGQERREKFNSDGAVVLTAPGFLQKGEGWSRWLIWKLGSLTHSPDMYRAPTHGLSALFRCGGCNVQRDRHYSHFTNFFSGSSQHRRLRIHVENWCSCPANMYNTSFTYIWPFLLNLFQKDVPPPPVCGK